MGGGRQRLVLPGDRRVGHDDVHVRGVHRGGQVEPEVALTIAEMRLDQREVGGDAIFEKVIAPVDSRVS